MAAAIHEAGGRVFIGLKNPEHARGVDASGRLLTRPDVAAQGKSQLRAAGVRISREFDLSPTIVADLEVAALPAIRRLPFVDYVEPVTQGEWLAQDTTWNIRKVGTPWGWTVTTGSHTVRVLILDSGTDLNHEDLAISVRNTCVGGTVDDQFGHGTFVAGIVAAVNNQIGIIGGAHAVTTYSMKVGNTQPDGEGVICGINWGRVTGNVFAMNMSISIQPSEAVTNEINLAYNEGRILVAAAGNTSGGPVTYPASLANVIAVGATTSTDALWGGSAVGTQIELVAPGADVVSTTMASGVVCPDTSGYSACSGTSFAAPHVAFAAALVKSATPSLTNAQVRARLQQTALDLGVLGRDNYFGYGRLDVAAALGNQGGGGGITFIDIVGPECLYGGGSYTYQGQVSGGTPPYVYQWYRDIAPYEGSWEYFGTGQTKTMAFPGGNYSARLKLRVTDNVAHLRETIEVVQMLSSGGPNNPNGGWEAKWCAGGGAP